ADYVSMTKKEYRKLVDKYGKSNTLCVCSFIFDGIGFHS
ncbi:unnamed protein product, partial [marine sediment metagenome]